MTPARLWHSRAVSDPFLDPLFRDRARKLLAVLASDQPGEAEAARRKLLLHLETHGAAWSDLVDRVDVPSSVLVERQALRQWVDQAEAGLRDAQAAAAAADARAGRADRRARLAFFLLGGGMAVGTALAAALLLRVPPAAAPIGPPTRLAEQASGPAPPLVPLPSRPGAPGPARDAQVGGQVAYVRADGAPLRPALAGAVPARPLPGGAPVVVVGRAQYEGAEWFRVRSEQGEGFLPAEAVDFTAPPLTPGPPADGAPAR